MALQGEDLPQNSRVVEICGGEVPNPEDVDPASYFTAFQLPAESSTSAPCLLSGIKVFDSLDEPLQVLTDADAIVPDYRQGVEESGGTLETEDLPSIGTQASFWELICLRCDSPSLSFVISFAYRNIGGVVFLTVADDKGEWRDEALIYARILINRVKSVLDEPAPTA